MYMDIHGADKGKSAVRHLPGLLCAHLIFMCMLIYMYCTYTINPLLRVRLMT